MKKIFSNYYKIILSVVILIVLVALKEDYKTSFDEMSGVRTVVRMLLYTAWGFLLATRTSGTKQKVRNMLLLALPVGSAQSVNPHLELPDSVLCFCRRCSGTLFYGIYSDRNIRRLLMGTEGLPH